MVNSRAPAQQNEKVVNLLEAKDDEEEDEYEYEEYEDEVDDLNHDDSKHVFNPPETSKTQTPNRSSRSKSPSRSPTGRGGQDGVEDYGEEEESPSKSSSYDPSMDETMRINIDKQMRMDDTIDSMGLERKTRLAGYIVDYVENNLPRYVSGEGTKPSLFDKSRENRADRELKFKLMKKFNVAPSRFPNSNFNSEFDLGIPCDLLLDLFRYEDEEILNPSVIV